jgi:hypothetical protein
MVFLFLMTAFDRKKLCETTEIYTRITMPDQFIYHSIALPWVRDELHGDFRVYTEVGSFDNKVYAE